MPLKPILRLPVSRLYLPAPAARGSRLKGRRTVLKPDHAGQPAQKAMALGQLDDLSSDPPIEEAEIAGVARDGDDGDPVDDPVADVGDDAFDQRLALARGALGDDDLVAGPPEAHHLRDQPGRVLQIAVDDHDRLTGGVGEAADRGGGLAEAAREEQQLDPGSRACSVRTSSTVPSVHGSAMKMIP